MIKHLIAVLFYLSCSPAFSADVLEPMKAIEQFGAITIGDGSSFFSFAKDGSFDSGPLGESGRSLKGYWFKDENGMFVVTARLGWVNGLSLNDQYRRIVFHISHVSKNGKKGITSPWTAEPDFDSYFLIDEMIAIPKPAKPIPN
ncbi:MAG: hypothetical protein NTY98_26490 [Verrucomicrobia bacterium]|nr:hypothetical protein [Verrucomicrobiota bacterium]